VAIAVSIRIRVAAESPSLSHPAMPDNGSDIVPELAVTGSTPRVSLAPALLIKRISRLMRIAALCISVDTRTSGR